MKKIFNKEAVSDIYTRTLETQIQFLRSEHDFPRSKTAILIGNRINEDYEKYADLLLSEMNIDMHFLNVRFGIKSARTIALVLAENLKPVDYPRLKEAFEKWDDEEKAELIKCFKDHAEQIKILTEG